VVGASIEFTVELPEELVSWIAALGDRTGCSRSEVLSECLQSLRGDRRLASALENRLAAKRPR
jgi:metal-responsive CopG/Arc/MetJ family transcriptional regulator